jgi:nitronate monooxygenase
VKLSPLYRAALENVNDDGTALTNLFTGRPARGAMNRLMRERGPLSNYVPRFPLAGAALAPLRAEAERKGHDDFTNLWSGQAAPIARRYPRPAAALTRCLAEEALKLLCQGMRVGAESGG